MVQRFKTTTQDSGKRLDQFLHENIPDLSKTRLRKIIDLGGVHVTGKRQRKCGLELKPETTVELHLDNAPLEPYRIVQEDVIYQDSYIIVLNKPAGIETQPTPARFKGTLYEALQLWLERDRRFGRKLEIGMVQRLDRDTSGLLVFSIHPQAHKKLSEVFQNRSVQKTYLAIVAGVINPEQGEIRSSLMKDRRTGLIRSVETGGKQAVTRYRILRTFQGTVSLVEVDLQTGRTHQIRAHMSEVGCPLLGDIRYGGPARIENHLFKRQCLHSHHLQFTHPVSGEELTFTSPLPADMSFFLNENEAYNPPASRL